MMEPIKASLRGGQDAEDPMRAELRRENIERAARDFGYERSAGLVEYIRDIQRHQESSGSGYNVTPLLWQLSGIKPDSMQVFARFKPRLQYPTVRDARDAAKAWSSGSLPPLLTLAGTPGTGKTFLAIAATQAIIERGGLVMYLRIKDLLTQYPQQQFGHRSPGGDMEADLRGVTYLIIDDLGLQKSTDWRAEFLDDLVDFRYTSHRRLMVCTNQKGEDLPPRIADRLSDVQFGRVVQIDAPSYRQEARR